MTRFFIVAAILFVPAFSHAEVVISEIMYDLAEGSDSGREWVEVYNESGAVEDLSEWKLFENSTNHGIKALAGSELVPGAYAVIADNAEKFKGDHPNYSGLLFDSAFSLNNAGETLTLRCCGKELRDIDTATYSSEQGGKGDGASLSRSGATFVPTDPTPGEPPGAARMAEPEVTASAPSAVQKLPEPPKEPEPQREEAKTIEPAPTSSPTSAPPAPIPSEQKEEVGTPLPAAIQKQPAPKQQPGEEAVEEPRQGAADGIAAQSVEDVQDEKEKGQIAAAASVWDGSMLWWGGALLIVFLGAGAALAVRRVGKNEWNIEDMSDSV